MSLYNSRKSTSKYLETKMLFVYGLFVLVILSIIIYTVTKDGRERKEELLAIESKKELVTKDKSELITKDEIELIVKEEQSLGMKRLERLENKEKTTESIRTVYMDDEQLSDLTAKRGYQELRGSFVIVLGKLSAYESAYPDLSPSMRLKIIEALSNHSRTISIEMNQFQHGIKDATYDINQIHDQYGVTKSEGKLELERALSDITWLMNQLIHQNQTLDKLRMDIKSNPREALKKLYEIANEED